MIGPGDNETRTGHPLAPPDQAAVSSPFDRTTQSAHRP